MVSVASGLLQALALLGKLGGRNRRFLKDPLELDLKDNPEHGLRLILTFQPSTSFLVPLDRCLALSSQSLLSPNSTSSQLHSAILCVSAYGCGWSCSVAGKRHELREVLRGMFYHALCQCTCCGWSCSVIGK